MKLEKASITFLVSTERTTIEIKDHKSGQTFLKITLTPEQLSMALSRLSYTPCEAEVYNIDKLGKTLFNESFEFEIPKELRSSSKAKELSELCLASLAEHGMSDWTPDIYFSSQNSFFNRDGKEYARAVIRRWL